MNNDRAGDQRIKCDDDGQFYIPATQRPDGSWRKPKRVKAGYVPQEEVPVYESKGKQFAKDAPTYPVGLSPEMIAAIQKTNSEEKKSTKKKKPASVTIIKTTDDLRRLNLTNDDNKNASTSTKVSFVDTPPPVDPRLKKLKNLRKKLNDIDVLQKRIDDGELKQPEKNQLDKIHKRSEIMDEIEQLEREIGSSSNDS